jgi:hypothetical protein
VNHLCVIKVTTGEWRDEKKNIPTNDKEVIINGVCVMNQSSDFKSANDDGDEENSVNQSNDDGDDKLTIADGNEDADEIKKSFIKKPNKSIDNNDDNDDDGVKVKKEVEESNAWEY